MTDSQAKFFHQIWTAEFRDSRPTATATSQLFKQEISGRKCKEGDEQPGKRCEDLGYTDEFQKVDRNTFRLSKLPQRGHARLKKIRYERATLRLHPQENHQAFKQDRNSACFCAEQENRSEDECF